MSKEIYNEGRVVGFSAYELYVKNAIASGLDPIAGEVATEREWLGSMLAMGAAMIVEVPSFNGRFIDIPFPSQTRLCAANTIIASFFDGEAVFLADHWATKVMRYHPLVANGATTYPSGPTEATDIPHGAGQSGEYTRTYLKKFQDYLKIDKGVILQGGTWTESADYGLQEVEPHYDLTKVQVDKRTGEPSPIPVLRLFASCGGEYITHNPMILLIGFTDRNILRGTSVLSGGSADPIDNDHVNGGFLGPEIFPWCTPIVFTTPAGYEKYMHGIQTTDQVANISSSYTIFDINTELEDIYGDEENTIYTLYCESTPSGIAGVDMRYKYLSSPTFYTSVLNVYSQYGDYPPALYANFQEPVPDGTVAVRHQYPVDVVAPGTVKIFRNNDNDTLIDYESKFVGTTALNLTNGILSMQGSEGLYELNNITSGNAAVTVNRNATTGAWEISADTTGQINVTTDANTSSIKITPSTVSGVKTFTVSQTIRKKSGTNGLAVTSSNGVVDIENTLNIQQGQGITVTKSGDNVTIKNAMELSAGVGISVIRDNNGNYKIINTRPVLTSSDMTDVDYTGYRVFYAMKGKKFHLNSDTTYEASSYTTVNGYSTGVIRRTDYSDYSWKDDILNGTDGDTAHREKLGLGYSVSRSGNIPIAVTLSFNEETYVDAGDPAYIPPAYDSTHTYSQKDYCYYSSKKYRCSRNGATGTFDSNDWVEVSAVVRTYSSTVSYKVGDYCMHGTPAVQYACKEATTGNFDSTKWYESNELLPSIRYGLCISDARSKNAPSGDIPQYAALRYGHGKAYNDPTTTTINGSTYDYYPWDRGLIARIALTPAMCKKIFFGNDNYNFTQNDYVLIDGPTSNSASEVINWRVYTDTASSSALSGDQGRLKYPVAFRVMCRYPFIVENGNVMMANYSNIQSINAGWLSDNTHFRSAVSYTLSRDTEGRVLSSTNDAYKNFAMVFDIIAESVEDGINSQITDLIDYEGHPVAPYVIASDNAHMGLTLNLRLIQSHIHLE